jgi:uncharacterized protein (DUF1697 family)
MMVRRGAEVTSRIPTLKPARFIGLLRGVNLGGRNRVPMGELRSVAESLGWKELQTYIQSGNVVFTACTTTGTAELQLEQAIERHFKLQIPVVVRSVRDWSGYIAENPFPAAIASQPGYVILALSKSSAEKDALVALRKRADKAESVVQLADDAFCIHFGRGLGKSKLFPLLNRLVGSPVTARNWLTVLKLRDLAEQTASNTREGMKSR